ncbi:signal recognition particle receptor alpha subunit, putative [Brugia malayi]|uniref:Bm3902 n=1 Tax=Brugia malayi TaxID=6279 RepID=A0A0I9NB21_BRUMA|nr:signal recognition particle receptor alpha subunit, putative [Brugia malayi]CTP81818.1 Bm3902 [Brugia malayi]VIO95975.1 signal recognition particle receptor alpha subunit, putative [Brugia malayi]
MIELFTIFGKGGIVLWCFQEGGQLFTDSINQLIREVLMQERGNTTVFKHNDLTIKYKLDNEFELVFIVVYQSAIQLAYTDQLLSDVHKKFRDMYKNVLSDNKLLFSSTFRTFRQFSDVFQRLYREAQILSTKQPDKVMRKFEESEKSKKTIASIIERPNEKSAKLLKEKEEQQKRLKHKNKEKVISSKTNGSKLANGYDVSEMKKESPQSDVTSDSPKSDTEKEEMQRRRVEFFKKKGAKKSELEKQNNLSVESKKGKQARVWDLSGNVKADIDSLDYSKGKSDNAVNMTEQEDRKFVEEQMQFVGHFKGELPGLIDEQNEDLDVNEDMNDEVNEENGHDGWFSAFRSLVGNKKLTVEDIKPVLDKMRETLIAKNVAADPAEKLCQSVEVKLEGKVVGTFSRVASIVKESVRDALVQLLTPKRRVDILRDILEAKREKRPYIIVFCGVNGVGKSTNLAKITFWLNENGHKVLIAAADTFRAGAVEQLRTHTKHLNALHPNSVQLYEQGYGKDPAGLAAAAISIAVERGTDVVLVDTAGRMQDNEPLMRSLAKLIQVNQPDLVLFVGEALVGNEAVDQLVKFNQSLADHAALGDEGRLIDGIVLTKFDTIDDKVGAAISMTYITGQPIVFVGTGQTYKDLKSLNASAVVHSLLK